MCKNFIQNIGLKQHITAVHEERDSIMINVAKNLHYLKVYIEIVHKKNFEFNCDHQGIPYSRREATLFQGVRLFYNLILKSVILNDIVALFLCKPSAIGSKTAKLLATLDFKMLPELYAV